MSEVTCVNADGCHLTDGKTYRVQALSNGWITVVNDIGRVSEYPIEYFSS